MSQSQVRTYAAQARSTDTFGRVLCTARNHHFVVDGPVQNGCPGEAVNPGELFLARHRIFVGTKHHSHSSAPFFQA